MEMLFNGAGGGATFTIERWYCVEVGRRVRDNVRFSEDVKTFGANGIDAKTIVEGVIAVKEVIDGAGGVIVEGIVNSGMRGECSRKRDARWECGR
jgi:hypothetical protein